MASMFGALGGETRPQCDVESVVFCLLRRAYPSESYPRAVVMSEISLATNGYADSGQVVVYQCGSPTQVDVGLWSCPLSLNAIGESSQAFTFAADLYAHVSAWPYQTATPYGSVSSIEAYSGFHRVHETNENGGKNITDYVADFTVLFRDPLKA